MLHLLDEFLLLHKKNDYFFWWFLNRLSHKDPHDLGRADNDYFKFFKRHFDSGKVFIVIHCTVIIPQTLGYTFRSCCGLSRLFSCNNVWQTFSFPLTSCKDFQICKVIDTKPHVCLIVGLNILMYVRRRVQLEVCVYIHCILSVGTFENTLVIFGSDHGTRFGNFRQTPQGRIEERLPLQLLIFPKWFKQEYKSLYETLQVFQIQSLMFARIICRKND